MSQAKVDKRKQEKKNRASIKKKKKIKKIAGYSIFGIIVGCILGGTIGVKIYKSIPKYVDSDKFGAYVNEVWAENGYNTYFTTTATDSDAAEGEDTVDAVEDTVDDTVDTTN
jgi:hypothetical protein